MPDALTYPNRIARYFMLAGREVLGKHGLNAIYSLADLDQFHDSLPPDDLCREFRFDQMAAFNRALEEMYGVRGGRGMAQRIGRAWLGQGMMTFGALAGVNDPAFKRLTPRGRCYLGLLAVADIFTRFSDQKCRVENRADSFHFIANPCAIAYGRKSDRPVCMSLLGLLQETVRWVTDGYDYPFQETTCHAAGDEVCTFVLSKKPFGS